MSTAKAPGRVPGIRMAATLAFALVATVAGVQHPVEGQGVGSAQLWVGNWPAVWSGDFQYDIQHLYVDWVKISALPKR